LADVHVKEILLKIDGSTKHIDMIHEECDETRNGTVSNDKDVR
jgi:hypothetical protein